MKGGPQGVSGGGRRLEGYEPRTDLMAGVRGQEDAMNGWRYSRVLENGGGGTGSERPLMWNMVEVRRR